MYWAASSSGSAGAGSQDPRALPSASGSPCPGAEHRALHAVGRGLHFVRSSGSDEGSEACPPAPSMLRAGLSPDLPERRVQELPPERVVDAGCVGSTWPSQWEVWAGGGKRCSVEL